MTPRSRFVGWAALAALGAVLVVPAIVGAQEGEGFDGYIQSGTCAAPTDDLRVQLDSDGDHDVEPYLATDEGDTVELGYYGSPLVPGFGFSAIYTDQRFSLVIADTDTGDPVACGDIFEPDADRFAEAGVAVVQLLPVGDSTVQGVAVIQRTQLERELDVIPTRVRIVLSTDAPVAASAEPADGFDGYISGGTCAAPTDRLRVQLKSRGDHDVRPFLASPDGSSEPVPVAYHGAPLAPGFGLAAAHTDQRFSLVLTDTSSGDPVSCGDILPPDSDDFADAGLAMVQLLPVGDSGTQGFGLIERIPLQRELDVIPTRVRIVLFAPPAQT
jgi:hypothetical protein